MVNRNLTFGILSAIISGLQSLWFVPYVKDYVGYEAYGYISVVNSFVNIYTVVSLSLTSMSNKFIVVSLQKKEYTLASKYFSSIFYSLLSISCFIILSLIIVIFKINNLMNIDDGFVLQVQVLMAITGTTFIFVIISTPYVSCLYYKDAIYIYYLVQIFDYISRIIFTIFFFRWNHIYIWISALGSLCVYVISFFLYLLYKKKYVPVLEFKRGYGWLQNSFSIMKSGIWVSVTKAGVLLLSSLTSYFSNLFCSSFITGIYAAILQLESLINVIISILINCFLSKLYKIYSACDYQKTYNYVVDIMTVIGLFLGIMTGALVSLGTDFMVLWVGKEYINYTKLLVLSICYFPLIGGSEVINQLLITMGKVKIPALFTIFFGIINIILMLIFVLWLDYGIYGIVYAKLIAVIIRALIFFPFYMIKVTNFKSIKLYVGNIVGIGVMIVMICLCSGVKSIMPPVSWFSLSANAILCSIVCFTCIIIFSNKLRTLVRNYIN